MRRFPSYAGVGFTLGLALSLLASPSRADCHYFRTAYRMLQCKEVPPQELKVLDRGELELPEVPDQPQGRLMRVRCSCDYALAGSDPRCDFDRTQEQSSVIGAEPGEDVCARGKELCNSVCAKDNSF